MERGEAAAKAADLQAKLAAADERAAAGAWRQALEALRAGLEELGAGYLPEGVKDDSGLLLLIAEQQAADGELPQAFAQMRDVAEGRLAACRERGGLIR
jgi:hypothetical protein